MHPKPARFYTQTVGAGHFRDVYFCAPTRIRAKFSGFHISVSGHVKNAPDFTFPNKDTPKTRPILGANRRRRTFRGVCNTPLHGYVKNPSGFIFPHTDTYKTYPVSHPNPRRGYLRGVCNTPLHGYVQNLADFRRKPLSKDISGRMQYAPTQIHEKFGGFHISANEYAKNAPGFRRKPLSQDI